jgi:hypothetical protein
MQFGAIGTALCYLHGCHMPSGRGVCRMASGRPQTQTDHREGFIAVRQTILKNFNVKICTRLPFILNCNVYDIRVRQLQNWAFPLDGAPSRLQTSLGALALALSCNPSPSPTFSSEHVQLIFNVRLIYSHSTSFVEYEFGLQILATHVHVKRILVRRRSSP